MMETFLAQGNNRSLWWGLKLMTDWLHFRCSTHCAILRLWI